MDGKAYHKAFNICIKDMHTPNFTLLPINNHLQLELLSLTDEKTSFSLFLLK